MSDCPTLKKPISLVGKNPNKELVVLSNVKLLDTFKLCKGCPKSDDIRIDLFPIEGSKKNAIGIQILDQKNGVHFGFESKVSNGYQKLDSEHRTLNDGTDYRITVETRFIETPKGKKPYTFTAGFQTKDNSITQLGLMIPDMSDIKSKTTPGHYTMCLESADLK